MTFHTDYLDHVIDINNERGVKVLEISDKVIFNNILSSLYNATYYGITDKKASIKEYNGNVNLERNCLLLMEYYNLDINNKKNLTKLYKYIISYNNENEEIINRINDKILELNKEIKKLFFDFEFDLDIKEEAGLNEIFSLFKLKIEERGNVTLLDNIILYLDLIQELNLYKILIFINIKNYLSIQELNELYKYVMNNDIKILFLNSIVFSNIIEYEDKIVLEDPDQDFELLEIL